MSSYRVRRVQPLPGPGEEEARRYLKAIADDVQPLLINHRWSVGVLKEFDHPNLLGRNAYHGARIELLLRENGRFLPYGHVVAAMLHELAHCSVDGHGHDFGTLRDQLRAEWMALQRSSSSYGNYAGESSNQYGSSSSYGSYPGASSNQYGSSSSYGSYPGASSNQYGSSSYYGEYTGESTNPYGNYSDNDGTSSYNYNYDTYNHGSSSYDNNHGSNGCAIM